MENVNLCPTDLSDSAGQGGSSWRY